MIQPKKIMQQRFLERQSGQQGWLRKRTRCVWIMWGDCTLPETNIAPEIDGWKSTLLLGRPIFRCYVLGRVNLFYPFLIGFVFCYPPEV